MKKRLIIPLFALAALVACKSQAEREQEAAIEKEIEVLEAEAEEIEAIAIELEALNNEVDSLVQTL